MKSHNKAFPFASANAENILILSFDFKMFTFVFFALRFNFDRYKLIIKITFQP